MATTERRPRINFMTADRIDAVRGEESFESYVNDVLTHHADRMIGRPDAETNDEGLERLLTLDDDISAALYVDRFNDERERPGVPAAARGWIVIDDDSYDALGFALSLVQLRALRDTLTELIETA